MKNSKNSSLAKLVAFFLIVIALICTVGFASDGWQSILEKPDNGNEGENADNNADGNNNGENSDPDGSENQEELPVVNPIPEYLDYLTGLESTQEASFIRYMAFITRTDAPIYGLSDSALTIEITTEDGKTRFISFKKGSDVGGKIGSFAANRDYISYLINAFGGISVGYGDDDRFEYTISAKAENELDFSRFSGYSYTEYSEYVYTNADLLSAFINKTGINTSLSVSQTSLPFNFAGYYDEKILGNEGAVSISICYGQGNTTELIYSSETEKYMLSKNGSVAIDLINNKKLEYNNVFVLFADSVTFETTNATQTIISTDSQGVGYYISNGKMQSIRWSKGDSGELTFLTSDGEKLTVNRGTSYIGYVKSSQIANVKVS